MFRTLHRVSAFFFYLLGLSFFGGFLLIRNGLGDTWPAWWLQVADVPFAFTAALFAGLSLYASVKAGERHSLLIGLLIGIPLLAFVSLVVWVNFGPSIE